MLDRRSVVFGAVCAAVCAPLAAGAGSFAESATGSEVDVSSLPAEYREEARQLYAWLAGEFRKRIGPDFIMTPDNVHRLLTEIYDDAMRPYPAFKIERDPENPSRVVVLVPSDVAAALKAFAA